MRSRAGASLALALAMVVAAAVVFAVSPPPVGDLWAARARQSAARDGVGLGYWFSWFGGTVPGHYSVLAPSVWRVVDAGVLGAVATAAAVALTALLVRGSRHPAVAVWVAAIAGGFSLWSGRVPFAFGSVLMLGGLLAVRYRRSLVGAVLGALAALVSPVTGAFLVLGLVGVFVHDRARRTASVITALPAVGALLAVGAYFGQPGPEGFDLPHAWPTLAALLVLLVARPAPVVRTVVLLSIAGWPIVTFVPNGLGGNYARLAWICLPVAAAATARAGWLRTAIVTLLAVVPGLVGTVHDLGVAAMPMSSASWYDGLQGHLRSSGGLGNHRLELVPDGTHVGADVLLGPTLLARGYETQADNQLNAVLMRDDLDAARYRRWLDDNAVGWVLLDRHTNYHGPEDTLVRRHRPDYLRPAWSDAHWQLFRVTAARPVVAAPARLASVDQSRLVVTTPRAGRFAVRTRWSRFLAVDGGARVVADAGGWTVLVAPRAGSWVLHG